MADSQGNPRVPVHVVKALTGWCAHVRLSCPGAQFQLRFAFRRLRFKLDGWCCVSNLVVLLGVVLPLGPEVSAKGIPRGPWGPLGSPGLYETGRGQPSAEPAGGGGEGWGRTSAVEAGLRKAGLSWGIGCVSPCVCGTLRFTLGFGCVSQEYRESLAFQLAFQQAFRSLRFACVSCLRFAWATKIIKCLPC